MTPARKDYKKRTEAEKARDDERFMELHLQKYSYRQIAEMLSQETGCQISYQTVFASIKEQTTAWKEANQDTVNREMQKAMAVLDLVEKRAWEGYFRSCTDAVKTTTVREADKPEPPPQGLQANTQKAKAKATPKPKAGPLPIVKETQSVEGQAGDSSFLRVIAQCQLTRAKLFESCSLKPKLSKALEALAKAMGIDVEPD
jgi:tRNA G10  N-methylase Trm11